MRKVPPMLLFFASFLVLLLYVGQSMQFADSNAFPQLVTNEFRARYFSVKKDHRLRAKMKSKTVDSDTACIQYCMADSCTSVNFKKTGSGIHACELISNEMPKIDEALERDNSFDFISLEQPIYKDCGEIYKGGGNVSGVYIISTTPSRPIQVYCDMVTSGGGWTVIQKRIDGSVDFSRDWAVYKRGFGNKLGEYWLGLDHMHRMTSQKTYRLRVDMEDFEKNKRYAEYGLFKVADEQEKYRLTVGSYSGDAVDAMVTVHNGMAFSTKDRDNDKFISESCASKYNSGWWFNDCFNCNPNGFYYLNCYNACPAYKGIIWEFWRGVKYSLKKFELKIRPNRFKS